MLNKIKIGIRISIALFLPIAGMLFFSGYTVIGKYEASSEMGKVLELANFAPAVSALVHEMQKERGASAGFIASKGAKFKDTLPNQRTDTDEKLEYLKQALKVFQSQSFGSALVSKIGDAQQAIKELKRVLNWGGVILFSVPVDAENKIYFNAHRAFTREYILELFEGFEVIEEKYHYGTKMYDSYEKNKGFGTGLYMLKKREK